MWRAGTAATAGPARRAVRGHPTGRLRPGRRHFCGADSASSRNSRTWPRTSSRSVPGRPTTSWEPKPSRRARVRVARRSASTGRVCGSDRRLPLGDAVDTATRCEDRTGVHEGHRPLGEEPPEDRGRLLVTRVVEGAQHHTIVAEVVVDVGVVDQLTVLLDDGRGGHLDDLQLPPPGVGGAAQQLADLLADRVVGVVRVGLGVDQHGAGAGEGGDDVDMAAGAELPVVGGQAARQPDRLGGAEVGVELGLHLLLGTAGVAVRVELDGLGEQDGALAVDVDAAALVDQRRGVAAGAGQRTDLSGDLLVEVPAGPFLGTPAVEHPVGGGESTAAAGEEGGADIAHPGVVERALDDLDVRAEQRAGAGVAPGL